MIEPPKLEFTKTYQIRHVAALSSQEFNDSYFDVGVPVVVDSASRDWSFDLLGATYGEQAIAVHDVAQGSANQRTVAELVASISDPGSGTNFYSQHALDDDWSNELVGRLIGDPWFPEPKLSYLWLGNDVGGIGLHQDDGYKNLVIQVIGKKHCVLIPPSEAHLLDMMSLYSGAYSEFPFGFDTFRSKITSPPKTSTAFDIDWAEHPQLRSASAHVCVLEPGQCLFVPTSWFHLITNLGPSFSISMRWENADWLENRRTYHAVLDLFIAFIRHLPDDQRTAFSSRMRSELDAHQYVNAELLDGPMPPAHLFGWPIVRDAWLEALVKIIGSFNRGSLDDRLPIALFETIAKCDILEGTSGIGESSQQFFLRPSTAKLICEMHRLDKNSSNGEANPVLNEVRAILYAFIDQVSVDLREYRTDRSIALEDLVRMARQSNQSSDPNAIRRLHELLLDVSEFN